MRQRGFSLIEIVVALAVIGLIVIGLTNLLIMIDVLQRKTRHLSLATRSAESKLESLRNNHYNSLPLSPPAIDFTNELPADLPEPRSATVEVSEPNAGMKRLDVTITYRDGSGSRTVKLSGLLGNLGISQ